MSSTSAHYGHFDPNKQIHKYSLDDSTFDLIDVDRFKNTKFSTVFLYLFAWFMMILSCVLLGTDIYTCLNILVFHHWSTATYKPYAYSIAKWIFTGCIIFEFVLMAYKLVKGLYTYRTRNIALAYVNNVARLLYSVRSYNYFCLFNAIEHDNFFDWASFLCHTELSGAFQLLIADTPRQVINVLTLRYYATDSGTSNDIIQNIKTIADTNLSLSIILSFIVLSVVIWSIFFFKFCFAMILYLPVMYKLREKGFKSFKKYCCSIVNERVRSLVFKNHRPKNELLELGIVDLNGIANNPLLHSSTTSFNLNKSASDLQHKMNDPVRPTPAHTFSNNLINEKVNYSDQFEMTALPNMSSSNVYNNRNQSSSSLTNPFIDSNRFTSKEALLKPYTNGNESFMRDNLKNPFLSKSEASLNSASGSSRLNSNKPNRKAPSYLPYEATPLVDETSSIDLSLESLQEKEKAVNFADEMNNSTVSYKGNSEEIEIESEFDFLDPEERSLSVGSHDGSIEPETEPIIRNNNPNKTLVTPYPVRGVSLYKENDDEFNEY